MKSPWCQVKLSVDDLMRLKQLEVGNCIMTLLVYVVLLSDKPERHKDQAPSLIIRTRG